MIGKRGDVEIGKIRKSIEKVGRNLEEGGRKTS
jgi:hypothetical protein